MAPAVDVGESVTVADRLSEPQILSQEEISNLLKEAEARLREAHNRRVLSQSTSISAFASLPKLKGESLAIPYLQEQNGIARADPARLINAEHRKLADDVYVPEPVVKKEGKKAKETAGTDWFDMPKTELTPELKRDLQLLQMRNVLDPHRHYKSSGKGKIPAFSQTGTVIEGPTDFYSARLNKRERKQTFAEEIVAGEKENGRFKRKYNEIQEAKTSGKKAHYKKLKEQRKRRG